jgi:hypothetical protein
VISVRRNFIWQKHWATIEYWDYFRDENKVFLTKEFLTLRCRGKIGIRNYKSDHHEFRDFW